VLRLAIGLPLRNQAETDGIAAPALRPGEHKLPQVPCTAGICRPIWPQDADYEAVKQFAAGNGLAVAGTYTNRVVLDVQGRFRRWSARLASR